jgi:hypothetical protein
VAMIVDKKQLFFFVADFRDWVQCLLKNIIAKNRKTILKNHHVPTHCSSM